MAIFTGGCFLNSLLPQAQPGKEPHQSGNSIRKVKLCGDLAHGFLTSNSTNNSRQTDQALRINLCPQCTHVRRRLCFSSRSDSPAVGMLSSPSITTAATTPSTESTIHPSPPHTCGITSGLQKRNNAYQHHQLLYPVALRGPIQVLDTA